MNLIFYSVDGGEVWEKYEGPLRFSPGTHTLLVKSADLARNMEEAKQISFSVTKGGWSKKVKISLTEFTVGSW